MRVILLIMIGISLLQADISKSGNIVKDTTSNLEWQDNEVGTEVTWEDTLERCESLELDGHSDWRVPNINELTSIVDKSKYSPAIRSVFENTSSSNYWSASTGESYKYNAWGVYFSYGYMYSNLKGNNLYVRCVRDGQ